MSPVIAKQGLEFLTVSNCHAFQSRTNVEGMVNQCRPRSGDNSYNEVCSAFKEPQKNVVSMRATKQTKDEFVRGSLLLSLTSKYRKMQMSGSSRRFASCVFPLGTCSIWLACRILLRMVPKTCYCTIPYKQTSTDNDYNCYDNH